MPCHPLTNFEIQKYYQNEPRFNCVFSRDNLPERSPIEIKDGAYIINLDEYSDMELIGLLSMLIMMILLILILLV